MGLIVLERSYDPPIDLGDVQAMSERSAWCMEQYRVRHVTSFLARHGRKLTCIFAAPDAEAIRSVLRQLDIASTRVWSATVHAPADVPVGDALATPDSALVVVERRFTEPVELAALQALEDRGASCLEAHRVRFLRTYLSLDGLNMLCAYAAPDAEAVRAAQPGAGMPYDDAWAALTIDSPG